MDGAARIRPAVAGDAAAISGIYNHYVSNGTATWAEEPETLAEREAWLAAHRGDHAVLVAEEADGALAGWASLSRFRDRSAWRFTAEDSIYLRHDRRGHGLGGRLLGELLARARAGSLRAVIACISGDQPASIALHRRFGFAEAGSLRRVGCKNGIWLDAVYMQLELTPP